VNHAPIQAIVAGHICLDLIPQFQTDAGPDLSAYLAPGRLAEVGPMTLSTGGAVANTGLNLARLGVRTRLMGKIGDDLLGTAVLDLLRQHGSELADAMIVVPGETSSYTIVINPPHIDRGFLHCVGANSTFGAEDVRYELLSEARVFHFGYPPLMPRFYTHQGDELVEMYRRAQETGVTTSLDMTMPDPTGPGGQVDWVALMRRAMPFVHLFLPSVEEWLFMANRARFDHLSATVGPDGMIWHLGEDEIRNLAEQALDMGARVVLLKLGARGLYLRTGPLDALGRGGPSQLDLWRDRELWQPAFRPDAVVGTTGAGDATIAGFITALLHDLPPERALAIAAAVGACNVEAADALSGVRTWQETLARLDGDWQHVDARTIV
jgi:sugar/nucleoside kinase (ribokinase family)